MSILKRLQDFPEWARPLVYFVVGALFFLVWALVFLHSGSGGEPVGQDPRSDWENSEEDIFCRLMITKGEKGDNQKRPAGE